MSSNNSEIFLLENMVESATKTVTYVNKSLIKLHRAKLIFFVLGISIGLGTLIFPEYNKILYYGLTVFTFFVIQTYIQLRFLENILTSAKSTLSSLINRLGELY